MSPVHSSPLSFADAPQLELYAQLGADLLLVPVAEGESPRLETSLPEDGVEIAREGDITRVTIKTVDQIFGRWNFDVDVRLVLHVPPNLRARVRTEFGRIRAERLDEGCNLELSSAAGTIELDQVTGRMMLRTGAGKISGRALAGTFDVETAAGSVLLRIVGLEHGHHRVRTNVGAVRVDLAKGIAVKLEAHAGMGSVRCRYPSTPDAPATLELATDLGAVKVREGGQQEDLHGDFPRWEAMPPFPMFSGASRPWAGAWAWGKRWARGEPPRPPPPPANTIRDEEMRRILSMVEQGKITAVEAEKLIRAIEAR